MFQPSKFQLPIFEYAKNETGHAIISACAGSGKTTTLLEIMKLIKGNSIFLAFNKSIADELKTKVPSHVEACTLHSLGLKILSKNVGKVQIDNLKLNKILDYLPGLSTYNAGKNFADIIEKSEIIKSLVSVMKASLVNLNDTNEIIALADYYSIDATNETINLAIKAIQKGTAKANIIDFDDMIYLPVVKDLNFPTYDYIFIDESQDLNQCQIAFVKKLVGEKSRIFAVGDTKQSIYGFRGADSKAMINIQGHFKAKELPLSICYRCPKSHIELAQEIVPYIEAAPNAIQGTINTIKLKDLPEHLSNDDLVLCRTNAPLIKTALFLIAKGKKATIKGQDIGKNLVTIVKKLKALSVNDLHNALNQWQNEEIQKLKEKNASENRINNIMDKVSVINIIANSCKSIDEIITKINSLFSDNTNGVILSTVHKAKGLEANNVFILNPKLLPLVWKNQKPWELDQEYNIKYVALTRSKNNLTFVEID